MIIPDGLVRGVVAAPARGVMVGACTSGPTPRVMAAAAPCMTRTVRCHVMGCAAMTPSLQCIGELFAVQTLTGIPVLRLEHRQRLLRRALAGSTDEVQCLMVLNLAVFVQVCQGKHIDVVALLAARALLNWNFCRWLRIRLLHSITPELAAKLSKG